MALTTNDLKAIRSIVKEEIKAENQPVIKQLDGLEKGNKLVIKRLDGLEEKVGTLEEENMFIIKRLDNLEKGNKLIVNRLDNLEIEQKKQGKDIRSMKLKINKTWRLFSWFTKDADERIVENRQRIKKLEEKIEFIQHN